MGVQARPPGGKSGFRLTRFSGTLTKRKKLAHSLSTSCRAFMWLDAATQRGRMKVV